MRFTVALGLLAGCASSSSKDPEPLETSSTAPTGDTSPPTSSPPSTPSTTGEPTTETSTTPGSTTSPPSGGVLGQLTSVDAAAILEGVSPDAGVGWAAGSAGDVNADGYDDVLVGTTEDDTLAPDNGALHLFLGPLTGTMDMTTAHATWTGLAAADHAGWLARSLGDANGDGFDDVLGQAHRYDGAGYHRGMAFVAFGPPAAGVHAMTDADIVLHGERDAEGFGMAVTGIGDTNGDGRDDLAVGSGLIAPGAVYVWHDGLVAGEWTTSDADAEILGEVADGNSAGLDLAWLGDTDGDGLSDLLVSDFWWGASAGAAYVVQAPFDGTHALEDAAGAVRGNAADQFMAIRVDATDLDGDGLGDPIVQSYTPNYVFLFPGGIVGETDPTMAAATISVGASGDAPMASPGDLDGDGTGEILVSNWLSQNGEGIVYVFYGPHAGVLGAPNAATVITGLVNGENVGTAVGAAGDVNADGTLDVLIGAQGYAANRGAVYLFDVF